MVRREGAVGQVMLAHNRAWARGKSSAVGQAEVNDILILRALTLTRVPIFNSLSCIDPHKGDVGIL